MGAGGNYPWSNNFNPSNANFRDRWRRQGGGPPSVPPPGNAGSAGDVGSGPTGPPPVNPGAPSVANPGASTKGGVSGETLGGTGGAPAAGGGTQNQGYGGPISGRKPYGAPDSPPMSAAPNNNDFNRRLTEGEYQNRWGDLMSRGPLTAADGQRSDLPTWSEFLAQSGQFNGGTNLDPMAADSKYRQGPMAAMPHAGFGGAPRLPGKEMQKWKGGRYVGDGKWENEGAGPTRSGGRPSGE